VLACGVRRIAAAIVVAAGVGLLSACGGSSTTATRANGWVGYSACMRAHGVPRFPDPASGSEAPPKRSLVQLGVSSVRFESAQSACRRLLPNGGRPPSQADQARVRAQALRFAECMRGHGLPGFPDPGSDGRIPDPGSVGIDQGSPKFEAANQACGADRPPYMPSNAAYNAWERSHG
jgi:hypothetical protein